MTHARRALKGVAAEGIEGSLRSFTRQGVRDELERCSVEREGVAAGEEQGEDGGRAGGKVRDSLANLVSGASRGTVREVRDVGVGRIGRGPEAGIPEESGEERRGHGGV